MKRFDCLGAMIENEYGPYCYAAHADREIDKAREEGRTAYVSLLPADWFEDASLETWFPLTAQSMRELREAHGAAVIAQSEAVERMEVAEEQFRKPAGTSGNCRYSGLLGQAMKTPRIPYLGRHLQKLNSEAAGKQKFPTLFVVLCVTWTVAVWFIAQREHEYAKEYERVQSIDSGEKTISTPATTQPRGDYEPLRFTF